VKRGYDGPVYVQNATLALCEIMLPDSGHLNERDAEWENRRRRRKSRSLVKPRALSNRYIHSRTLSGAWSSSGACVTRRM
jgi:Cft2 family RNA processing exonuclease